MPQHSEALESLIFLTCQSCRRRSHRLPPGFRHIPSPERSTIPMVERTGYRYVLEPSHVLISRARPSLRLVGAASLPAIGFRVCLDLGSPLLLQFSLHVLTSILIEMLRSEQKVLIDRIYRLVAQTLDHYLLILIGQQREPFAPQHSLHESGGAIALDLQALPLRSGSPPLPYHSEYNWKLYKRPCTHG